MLFHKQRKHTVVKWTRACTFFLLNTIIHRLITYSHTFEHVTLVRAGLTTTKTMVHQRWHWIYSYRQTDFPQCSDIIFYIAEYRVLNSITLGCRNKTRFFIDRCLITVKWCWGDYAFVEVWIFPALQSFNHNPPGCIKVSHKLSLWNNFTPVVPSLARSHSGHYFRVHITITRTD